jgi:uncharacterized OsmC-like protein
MAIVKLAALGAAGALIGGGAVHVAEKLRTDAPVDIKTHSVETEKVTRVVTHIATTVDCPTEEQDVSLVPQSPPDEQGEVVQPMPGPYYTAYYASAHHHHHGRAGCYRPAHYRAYSPQYPQEGPTPVPAPPMLVLFGAAACALIARHKLAKPQRQPA